MKTYAPKGLHGSDLRGLLNDLHGTPEEVAKFLHVDKRSIWRWLADGSAPWPVLALLWHETPRGRESSSCDVGNELVIQRTLAKSSGAARSALAARVSRLLRISDTGAANDPLVDGPWSEKPPLPRLARLTFDLDGFGFGFEPPGGRPGGCHGEGPADSARG
jgi:hypothetical protein